MSKLSIRDLELGGKRVFVRVDFNVPLDGGSVTDDTRIRETLPTLAFARERGARLVLASPLGRPRASRIQGIVCGPWPQSSRNCSARQWNLRRIAPARTPKRKAAPSRTAVCCCLRGHRDRREKQKFSAFPLDCASKRRASGWHGTSP